MPITSPNALFVPNAKPWVELTRLTQERGIKVGHKAQHQANAAYAERAGITIGSWRKESNVSTSDRGVYREVYEGILAEIEAGVWGGILVWRPDRLVRQSYEFERCLRLTRDSRALIATSCENWTTIDPDGVDRIRSAVAFAEREVEGMKLRIRANGNQRSREGLYHGGGFRPWCFEGPKRDKATGRVKNSGRIGIKHVEAEVELANEAANRIAFNGETYTDVIEDWHTRTPPVYGVTGAPWSPSTLQKSLTSPRMVGKQLVKITNPETGEVIEKSVKAQWKPVLPKATWKQLVSMLDTQRHKAGRIRYLLTPVLECGRCHRRLTGCARKYNKGGQLVSTPTYRCRSHANDKARGACGKLNVIAEPVERLVIARVFQRLMRTREFGSGLRQTDDLQAQIALQYAAVKRVSADLVTLENAQKDKAQRIPMAKFLEYRRPILDELDEVKAKLAALTQQLQVPHPAGEEWADLPVWFETLSEGQKAKLVLAHVKRVVVLPPGRSGRYFKPERVVVALADSHEVDGESE